jgi:hypothetical protein
MIYAKTVIFITKCGYFPQNVSSLGRGTWVDGIGEVETKTNLKLEVSVFLAV